MKKLTRITFNPEIMGGKPCIRGMRVTVGMIVGMIASGYSRDELLKMYPYLEPEDIAEALSYDKWDRQLESDSDAGKLDFLFKEALEAQKTGNLKNL